MLRDSYLLDLFKSEHRIDLLYRRLFASQLFLTGVIPHSVSRQAVVLGLESSGRYLRVRVIFAVAYV